MYIYKYLQVYDKIRAKFFLKLRKIIFYKLIYLFNFQLSSLIEMWNWDS